jgi:hypothetical protein
MLCGVAQEMNTDLGVEVGYAVRFDDHYDPYIHLLAQLLHNHNTACHIDSITQHTDSITQHSDSIIAPAEFT